MTYGVGAAWETTGVGGTVTGTGGSVNGVDGAVTGVDGAVTGATEAGAMTVGEDIPLAVTAVFVGITGFLALVSYFDCPCMMRFNHFAYLPFERPTCSWC